MRGGLFSSGRFVSPWSAVRRCLTSKRGGYTVIEVLVVLAVTAGLFVSAAIMISGRQNRTAFEQAVRQIQSEIQQVINEVATGYFPDNDFSCSPGPSGPVLNQLPSGGQGTKSGCIFLGKAMQFDEGGSDPEAFRIYTLAGLQRTSAGEEVKSYSEAMPKVVAKTSSNLSNPDISSSAILHSGLTTLEMYYLNIAGTVKTNVSSVAFVKSLAPTGGSGIVSGSQQVQVVPIRNTWLNGQPAGIAEAINNNFTISPINPVHGVNICFVSGSTNQSGLITIGGNNRDLSVQLDIKSNTSCA